MILHLLRCQGFGGAYYSLTLGRLGSAAPSAFATLGLFEELYYGIIVQARLNSRTTCGSDGPKLAS
jgi:hypothetical protein